MLNFQELQEIQDNRERIKKLVLDDLETAEKRQTKNVTKYAHITKLSCHGKYLIAELEILTNEILQFSQDMSDLVGEKDENPEVREWLSDPEFRQSLKPVFYGAVIKIPLKDLEKDEINKAIPFSGRIKELLKEKMRESDIKHISDLFESQFRYFANKHPDEVYDLLSEIPDRDEFNEYFWLEYTESELHGIEGDVFVSADGLTSRKLFLELTPGEIPWGDTELSDEELYNKIEELPDEMSLPDDFAPDELVMFNVGQGNFSGITDESDEIRLVFDIGVTCMESHDKVSDSIKSAIEEIKKINAEVFIISHYDLDHILAISYFENLSKDRIWIVPNPAELGELSKSAENLLKFLYLTQQPYKVSNDTIKDYNLQLLTNNKSLTLYKGFKLNKNNNPVKNMNGRGLLLHVQGKNNTALLTGDSLYEYWGDTLIQHIDPDKLVYLVVPHHCCEYNLTVPDGAVNAKIDIIPVGDGNKYGHPHHSHKDTLNGTIERTADYSITSGIKVYPL